MMQYDHFEHRHRFAVWAATRAVQRGWGGASTSILKAALEHCGVRQFTEHPHTIEATKGAFKKMHVLWCRSATAFLTQHGLSEEACSYGRAAKLIAVYLKSMIVVGGFDGLPIAALIHPPIDRVLLQTLAKKYRQHAGAPEWSKCNWTALEEASYFHLVDQLSSTLEMNEPLWKLEEYWTPSE